MKTLELILNIIIWVYGICFIPAVIFTYSQERMGMVIKDAPNRLLGIIFHFLTVWLIVPGFLIRYLTNTLDKEK